MILEVARHEFRLQGREFLTWVYGAVFFLLTFGYMSSGAVELVSDRGELARNAPWALAQAMAGVTAFGQVITTMIAATAVLRDVTTRQHELLFTTRLTPHQYLVGRWLGAVGVMALVYLAIPAGFLIGSGMPWVEPGALLPFDVWAYVRPFAWLVLPNVLVVSVFFFSAGALLRGFMAIVLVGVVLVALWGTGLALAREGHALGALIDPFGNAALEVAAQGVSLGGRAGQGMPTGLSLVANRIFWLCLAALSAVVLLRRFRFEALVVVGPRSHPRPVIAPSAAAGSARPNAPVSPPSPWEASRLEARWTLRWTLREKGFRTLASLGALNALANAWGAAGPLGDAGVVMQTVHEHSRVFLILVATIYAGELVWRDRDVRANEVADVVPAPTSALVWGRVAGLLTAQLVLVLPLLLVGLAVGFARQAAGMTLMLAGTWILGITWAFLAQLTLLSILVHAVVQHKVAAHVLLIAGWVLAVALAQSGVVPPLLRFATVPSFTWSPATGFGPAAHAMLWSTTYWFAVGIACTSVAVLCWVRGARSGFLERWHDAGRRVRNGSIWWLCAVITAATWAGWRYMKSGF